MRNFRIAFVIAFALYLTGCAIGYNTTFFMTKSNFGIDIESKPPTAEISIARREGVIEPSFDSQTLPVAAGFRGKSGLENFLFGVSSVFAGGDAAAIVTDLSNTNWSPSKPAYICLKEKPVGSFLGSKDPNLGPQENEIRPLFFGTDTVLGIKIAWDGMTSQFPDTFKAGFNRKELAIAPVNVRAGCGDKSQGFEVWMAPFIAWIDLSLKTAKSTDTDFNYAQGFATGTAAKNWAAVPKIKNLVLEVANPKLAEAVNFNTDSNAPPLRKRIDAWLRSSPENRSGLRKWLSDEKYAGSATGAEVSWLFSAPVEQLHGAINKFSIP